MTAASIRASMSKDLLAVVQRQWPQSVDRLQSALPAEAIRTIETASRVQWIPLETHTALNDAALNALARDRYRQAWRLAMLRAVESPTLRATVSGAIRLFGATPASLVKLAPRAWDLLARNAGKLTSETQRFGNSGRVTLTQFPPKHFTSGSWAEGLVGCIESFLDVCQTQGEVEVSSLDAADGRAVYEIRWR